VIYYCRTLKLILELVNKNDGMEAWLIAELYDLLDVLMLWQEELTAEHLYPSKNELGQVVAPAARTVFDLEATANFTSMAFHVLLKWEDEETLVSRIKDENDPLFLALYYFFQAEQERRVNIFKTLELLGAAIALHDDALFHYMQYLWIGHAEALLWDTPLEEKAILAAKAQKALTSANALRMNGPGSKSPETGHSQRIADITGRG